MDTSSPSQELLIEPGLECFSFVEINFITPLAIRKDSRLLEKFETMPFLTTLLRRLTNLNAFYGTNRSIIIDPATYLENIDSIAVEDSTKSVVLNRYSTRQQQWINYDGISGTVKLSGNLGKIIPLLKAGETAGIGKNTAVGEIVDMAGFFRINEWADAVGRLIDDADARKLADIAAQKELEGLKELGEPALVEAFRQMTDCIRNVDVNNISPKVSAALSIVEKFRTKDIFQNL